MEASFSARVDARGFQTALTIREVQHQTKVLLCTSEVEELWLIRKAFIQAFAKLLALVMEL